MRRPSLAKIKRKPYFYTIPSANNLPATLTVGALLLSIKHFYSPIIKAYSFGWKTILYRTITIERYRRKYNLFKFNL